MVEANKGLFEQVYEVVRSIPAGWVTTYGAVARLVGTKDARKVGWALHANRDKGTPCHRVVTKEGRVSESFAFGGSREHRQRLESEGVGFIDDLHVDMKRFCFDARKEEK